jgi:hypothetical protein
VKVLAWDKKTDTVVVPERAPFDGEWAAYFDSESASVLYKKNHSEPVKLAIRNITKGAFRSRLTQAEQAAFMGLLLAGNIAINVIDGTLRDTSHVDLDDLETIYSAKALEDEGVLKTSARVQELLNDGIESERYKG